MAQLKAGTTIDGRDILQEFDGHKMDKNNPHGVTKEQIGLGNVDNVKQASKNEFDQLITRIGNNEDLNTTQKDSIVLALNEVNQTFEEYKSETVYYYNVSVEKRYDDTSKTYYYLTHIKHKDANEEIIRLKQGLAQGDLGETPRQFANRNITTVTTNSSEFNTNTLEPKGVTIVNGEVIGETPRDEYNYILGIKDDNSLKAYPPETSAQAILDDGCNNALTAFIPLIEDGVKTDSSLYNLYHFPNKHPRQAIAQFANKDILFLTCGGNNIEGEGMTADDVARVFLNEGVTFAYMLDGGGSAQTVVRGTLINKPYDNGGYDERKLPLFLYVSKESDINIAKDLSLSNSDIGNVKFMLDILSRDVNNPNVDYVPDLNAINKTDFYWATATTANVPTSATYAIIHIQRNADSAMQVAFSFTTPVTIKMRRKVSGNWESWS